MTTYKILVIDDAFFIRNLIKKAVMRKPLKNDTSFEIIGEAQNGVEALDLCKELNPDIITVDFNIPELNGLDFAKYLKETNPKIPILMISSNTDPSFPSQVEEIGCHFLQKPFQESFLWMRLDNLAKEIEEFDENKIKKEEVSEETLSILKEISMEVEAELEEDNIELEEMTLPKANQNNNNKTSNNKKKKKKKKANNNMLFGLEIDDSLVIKPQVKSEPITKSQPILQDLIVDEIDINKKQESNPKTITPINVNINKEVIGKKDTSTLVLPIQKEDNQISNVSNGPKINLNQEKTEEPSNAVIEDEEILIEEDNEPIVIDDEDDDTLIVVEDEDEIIIEDDNENEVEVEDEDEIIIEDDDTIIIETEDDDNNIIKLDDDFDLDGDDEFIFDLDDTNSNGSNNEKTQQNKIGLNIKKKEEPKEDLSMLSEKDLALRRLKDNVSYSYQAEMSYVLHVMERLHKNEIEEKEKNNIDTGSNEVVEDNTKRNVLGVNNIPLIQPEDLTKEEENQEFDKLFAEFNPHMDIDGMNASIARQKEEQERERELEKKKLLESSPAISQKIVIEPPRSEKVKQLYSTNKIDENFVLKSNEQPKKVSIFTKIFQLFNKK